MVRAETPPAGAYLPPWIFPRSSVIHAASAPGPSPGELGGALAAVRAACS